MRVLHSFFGALILSAVSHALPKCKDAGTVIASGTCGTFTLSGQSVTGIQAGGTTCELGCSVAAGGSFIGYAAGCECSTGTNSGGTRYTGDAAAGTCVICTTFDASGAMLTGDPHLRGFNGQEFLFKGRNQAVFALVSNKDHQVNSYFDSLGEGVDADTWMLGFGLRYCNTTLTIELEHEGKSLETFIDPEAKHATKKRMRVAGSHAHMPLFKVTVNDMVMQKAVHSGEALTSGRDDVIIYFPPAGHVNEGDQEDGPIVVFRTPDLEFTIYHETEDALHLDINVAIVSSNIYELDGVIGSTLAWAMEDESGTPHNHTIRGEDSDYEVPDGLLGTEWTFSLFDKTQDEQTDDATSRRRELSARGAFVGHMAGRIGGAPSSLLPEKLLSSRRRLSAGKDAPRRFAGSVGRVGSASSLLRPMVVTAA